MRKGTRDLKSRADDMNANGILASMSFPSFPSYCGRLFPTAKDKELISVMLRPLYEIMRAAQGGHEPAKSELLHASVDSNATAAEVTYHS